MPVIKIDGPPIKDIAVKRKLVKDIQTAAETAFGMKEIVIYLVAREQENVGVMGELVSDMVERLKKEGGERVPPTSTLVGACSF